MFLSQPFTEFLTTLVNCSQINRWTVLNIGNLTRDTFHNSGDQGCICTLCRYVVQTPIYSAFYIKIMHLHRWFESFGLHLMHGVFKLESNNFCTQFDETYLPFRTLKKIPQHTISLLPFSAGVKERNFWENFKTTKRELPCPKKSFHTLTFRTNYPIDCPHFLINTDREKCQKCNYEQLFLLKCLLAVKIKRLNLSSASFLCFSTFQQVEWENYSMCLLSLTAFHSRHCCRFLSDSKQKFSNASSISGSISSSKSYLWIQHNTSDLEALC